MTLANAINLLKTASGLILNQKNVAFFREENYSEGNPILGALGIDTNTALGGLFSGDVKEVLVGGKSDTLGGVVSAIASFILNAEPLQAEGGRSVRNFEHPLEANISSNKKGDAGFAAAQNFITDHSIVMPSTFTCGIVFPTFLYTDLIKEMKNILYNRTLIAIVCKGDTYRNMTLVGYRHIMTVENISRMLFSLQWQETQIKYPLQSQSSDGSNASTSK